MSIKHVSKLNQVFKDSIDLKKKCVDEGLDVLVDMADLISKTIMNNNKIMLCGNGGSAGDAQHLAAEMLIRLKPENNRRGLPFITLATDTSSLTACGNDFGYDLIYKRILDSIGHEGDCLLVISTSGKSKNIIEAVKLAASKNIYVLGFLGSGGGDVLNFCDLAFNVPSNITGRIQETHITAGHALMELIENKLIEKEVMKIGSLF